MRQLQMLPGSQSESGLGSQTAGGSGGPWQAKPICTTKVINYAHARLNKFNLHEFPKERWPYSGEMPQRGGVLQV